MNTGFVKDSFCQIVLLVPGTSRTISLSIFSAVILHLLNYFGVFKKYRWYAIGSH